MKHELQATQIAQSSGDAHHLWTLTRIFAMATLIPVLVSCGNSTEVETTQNNNTGSGTTTKIYTGPAPLTQEVIDFKREFWDPLSESDRCGQCHTNGGQAANFSFVDLDNVNTAFSEAISNSGQGLIVDRTNPANSRAVTRVASGHNCWVSTPSVCANIIEGYISNWVNGSGSSSTGRTIQLTAPTIVDPGASRNFPTTAQDNNPNSFELTVYPLLTAHCSNCHSDSSATPQSPFFASPDVDASYEAAKSKIDLDTPVNSRFVTRLKELHNCWSSDCQNDATEMQTAIEAFAGAINLTQIDTQLVTSKAMTLSNAILASGGSRFEDNQIALWEFKAGVGSTAFDTSGVEPAMDLTFSGGISWVLGYGIDISSGGKAQASTTSSKKLKDLITLTGSYSIEAWIIPGNVTQEDARIISYSASDTNRNFAMSQSLYNYEFLNRSSQTDAEGRTSLITDDADEDLQATLQHVVMNFDPVNGRSIYVNGVFTDDVDDPANQGGSLIDWNDTYAFVLGNEVDSNSPWSGKLRMVAIHNNPLTQAQINQNYALGVGQKYLMLFSVADAINAGTGFAVPQDTFIMFEVEQFDNTAYLFNQPRFISLDGTYTAATSIPIQGMRIGVNGRETVSGQSYGNIDVQVNSNDYTADGQILSTLGTVIAVEKGPDSDEFFLTFELLGSETNVRVEADPVAPTYAADPELASAIGVKTFDEINATMSAVTGIPSRTPSLPLDQDPVAKTFDTYRQQLPAIENVSAFLASHQMAVAQLAMSYCNEAVNTDVALTPADPDRLFKGFDFNSVASVAFNSDTKKNQIVEPLLTGLMNIDTTTAPATQKLSTQPGIDEVKNMLGASTAQDLDAALTGDSYDSLITTMISCPAGGCSDDAARTREIAKALCAATLGSALTLIQ